MPHVRTLFFLPLAALLLVQCSSGQTGDSGLAARGGINATSSGTADGTTASGTKGAADDSLPAFFTANQVLPPSGERFDTLRVMADAADAVFVGRLTEYEVSATDAGRAAAIATFSVEELVSGELARVPVALSFSIATEDAAKVAAALPTLPMLLLLRSDDTGDRLVNDLGLWIVWEGELLAPFATEEAFTDELNELSSLAELTNYIRQP